MQKKTVSFLVSGRGSNFSAVAKQIKKKKIKAELGILISDNKNAKALTIAKEFGMESFFIDPQRYKTRKEFELEIARLMDKAGTDLIVAAGYMRVLTPFFVKQYKNRIINIHPALLPAFPGLHGQKKALEYGVKITGCTTHFIDDGTDTGPIIMQAVVPVRKNDTLAALSSRILKEEHRILPLSVKLFCEDRLHISGRHVTIVK